jgi:caffeoyl-CoA O-methyltransferase
LNAELVTSSPFVSEFPERDPNFNSYMRSFSDFTASAPCPVTPLSILAKKLSQLTQQAETIPSLDSGFKQELEVASQLATGLEPYIEAYSTVESDSLAELARKTRLENWAHRFSKGETVSELEQEMLSGHIEGQFLRLLLPSIKAKRVLEIGLFTGYSALAMAEGLPKDGSLIACEIDAYVAQFARECFSKSPHGYNGLNAGTSCCWVVF